MGLWKININFRMRDCIRNRTLWTDAEAGVQNAGNVVTLTGYGFFCYYTGGLFSGFSL